MKRLIILLIIVMLFVIACESDTQQVQNTEQQPYVGGGCGVVPVPDGENINQLPMDIMM